MSAAPPLRSIVDEAPLRPIAGGRVRVRPGSRGVAGGLARLGLLLALAVLPLADALAGSAAIVMSATGETALVRDGFRASPLRASAAVNEGDKLVTGADGRVELRFGDDAMVAIGPGSEFRIEQWHYDAQSQRSFFNLARGVIRQVSGRIGKRDPADYRLTTPTGVLAIRGTVFDAEETRCPSAGCEAGRRAGLAVRVIEGRVAVSTEAGTIEVPAGRAAFVGLRSDRPVLVDASGRGARTGVPSVTTGSASSAGQRPARPSSRPGGDGAWLGADDLGSARSGAMR